LAIGADIHQMETDQKVTKREKPAARLFSPVSLSDMCVAKIGQYIDMVPCLQGSLPEELVQSILNTVIEQRRMDDSVLERLLDGSIRSLNFNQCSSITDASCR
jgi:hypothetical protein